MKLNSKQYSKLYTALTFISGQQISLIYIEFSKKETFASDLSLSSIDCSLWTSCDHDQWRRYFPHR